jgi:hypothetical protein
MSNRAPQTRNGASRRRLAILWGIIAGFIILVLLLLGFCTSRDPDDTGDRFATAPRASQSAGRSAAPSTAPSARPSASRPSAGPSASTAGSAGPAGQTASPSKAPASRTAKATHTATHTVPPKGGPDTGGGSTAPSGLVLGVAGLSILLAAIGATVQAFRPRRSPR